MNSWMSHDQIVQPMCQSLQVSWRWALLGMFNDQDPKENKQKTKIKRHTNGICGISACAASLSWRLWGLGKSSLGPICDQRLSFRLASEYQMFQLIWDWRSQANFSCARPRPIHRSSVSLSPFLAAMSLAPESVAASVFWASTRVAIISTSSFWESLEAQAT